MDPLSMLDSLPRADVSKEMCNSKLLAKLTDKNWKVKKEGYDRVEEILIKANNWIEKTGLKDLMGALKLGLQDKNKSTLKTALSIVSKLAKALGPEAKIYTKAVMTPVLMCLADKQTLVWNATLEAVEQWKKSVGAELIINLCGKVIKPDNPEMRTVLLGWLIENKDTIPSAEHESLTLPLIACL